MIANQKDLAGGESMVDIRNKKRLNELAEHQNRYEGESSSALDESHGEESADDDGFMDAG